jgi:hypothetical protein
VIGNKTSIWRVTVSRPHNDLIRSREHLQEVREFLRPLMDRIKLTHGEEATLHIFPAVPVSVAIELGRIRMPKADLPWITYDQLNHRGGFIPAIRVSQESCNA